jgi:sec-independent protein translocase protein TatB
MFNIGSGEIALIAVAALLLLGPSRLPELARGIGKFMREFRRQTDEVRSVVEREFYKMDQQMSLHDLDAPYKAPTPGAVAGAPPAVAAAASADPQIKPNPEALAVGSLEQSQLMKGAPATTPVELTPTAARTDPVAAAAATAAAENAAAAASPAAAPGPVATASAEPVLAPPAAAVPAASDKTS